jgi:ribosome maturation factor RimP
MSQDSARVADLLREAVEGSGLVLEGVRVTPAGRRKVVRVIVDLPEDQVGSLDLDRVAEVSRLISSVMDAAEPFGQAPYVLEVTSPGVDRPLTERRHWARARGRLVQVDTPDATLLARVEATDEHGVTMRSDGVQHTLAWSQLGTGRVQVEFNRPGEPDEPDDSSQDG